MMRKSGIYRNICSIIIIFMLGLFLFLLRNDIPLYGDDVGGLVSNNPNSTYIDDRVVEGECELDLDYSLRTSWDKLVVSYFSWTGRVIYKFLAPLIRMFFSFPVGINWTIFSLYIMSMLLIMFMLVVDIASGGLREGMKNPLVVLIVGVLIFFAPSYSYAYMTRLIMYTFTNIYVASVVLYLAYYRLLQRVFERAGNISASSIPVEERKSTISSCRLLLGINLIGLLAGLSHEAYGVIFGAVLLTQLTRFWLKNHRKISIRYLFMYVGYVVGFCICFFAPGNFNRAAQSHESALHTVPLLARISNSIYIHAFVAYKIWIIPVIVLPGLVILLAILLKKRVLTVKDLMHVFLNNLEWFLGFGMSVVTWGMVARVVSYGMLLANVLLIIGVVRVVRELWELIVSRIAVSEKILTEIQIISAGISIAAVMLLTVKCFPQISDAHQVAVVWREDIKVARKVGMEEIVVPTYPEGLDYRFYDLTIINQQENYDKVSTQVVYGTRVVLDN
ncbi:MAG: hypothetical protein HDR18_15570 [Lachnospiraceae bacterium]|nr:hypothetical protein [Lachnospiraceae bacterium]